MMIEMVQALIQATKFVKRGKITSIFFFFLMKGSNKKTLNTKRIIVLSSDTLSLDILGLSLNSRSGD